MSFRVLIEFQWSDFDTLSSDWRTNSILNWLWIIEKNAMSARSYKKKWCQFWINFESNWKCDVSFESTLNQIENEMSILSQFRITMTIKKNFTMKIIVSKCRCIIFIINRIFDYISNYINVYRCQKFEEWIINIVVNENIIYKSLSYMRFEYY